MTIEKLDETRPYSFTSDAEVRKEIREIKAKVNEITTEMAKLESFLIRGDIGSPEWLEDVKNNLSKNQNERR